MRSPPPRVTGSRLAIIYAIEDDRAYEGTPSDDIVIQAGTSSFRGNGGNDLICNFDGEDMSFSGQ